MVRVDGGEVRLNKKNRAIASVEAFIASILRLIAQVRAGYAPLPAVIARVDYYCVTLTRNCFRSNMDCVASADDCAGCTTTHPKQHKKKVCPISGQTFFVYYFFNDAPMKSRNSGCGRVGRETNSGWN
jgi:hypothetical protein